MKNSFVLSCGLWYCSRCGKTRAAPKPAPLLIYVFDSNLTRYKSQDTLFRACHDKSFSNAIESFLVARPKRW